MPERVIIYASLGLRSGTSDLLWAFRKKNTLEEFPVYLDDHPFQVHDRIREEMKHGMRTADIVLVPHYVALQMNSEGLFTPHDAKDIGAYPAEVLRQEAQLVRGWRHFHDDGPQPEEAPREGPARRAWKR